MNQMQSLTQNTNPHWIILPGFITKEVFLSNDADTIISNIQAEHQEINRLITLSATDAQQETKSLGAKIAYLFHSKLAGAKA